MASEQKSKSKAEPKVDMDALYGKKFGAGDIESSAVGDELMRKAEKKLGAFFGGSKNRERAAELFEQAAAAYKMNNNWAEAAQALVRTAELLEKAKEMLEAANKYSEAGLCMARVDGEEGAKLLEMAISIHTMEGRLGAAARSWKALAELQEEELEDLQAAIEAWRKAADAHESEGTMANALQCLLHVAELHVKEFQFKKASKVYERCAEICMDRNINRGSLRDYFYNALLCQFVISARKGDLKNLRSMYSRFVELDRKFLGTWQQRLFEACMQACEEDDVQAFSQAIYDSNKSRTLDDFSTKLLLEVKRIMQNPRGQEADEIAEQLQ